ncbi:hypothetical protein BTA51_20060 [Hahella sp. CCB-MM4]|nr:hypothetical protein BTA51_20060 [Hahella sp. CCB-MM4]
MAGLRKARIIKESDVIHASREMFFTEKVWFLLVEKDGVEKMAVCRWVLSPLFVTRLYIDREGFDKTLSFFQEVNDRITPDPASAD